MGGQHFKNSIRDGGSTALYAAYTVDKVETVFTASTVYTVDMVLIVDMVYTVSMVYPVDMIYTVAMIFDGWMGRMGHTPCYDCEEYTSYST